VPIPFNINTLYELLPTSIATTIEQKLINQFGYNVKVPILKLKETDDSDLKFLANFVYEKIFLNYTVKQWGLKPEDINPEVTGRVPVFVSKDNRYFQDKYQALPKHGYTKLFEKMLDHPNIKVMLNTSMQELISINEDSHELLFMGNKFDGKLIYTGLIDELFNYKFGELPYRSLRFEFDTTDYKSFQNAAVINYPNNYDFTRITEFKKLTGQNQNRTTIIKEYPQKYDRLSVDKSTPCYPVFNEKSQQQYLKYQKISQEFENILLLGRLAEYKYYDMDDIVERSLNVFKEKVCI